jgi:hypothetical protein
MQATVSPLGCPFAHGGALGGGGGGDERDAVTVTSAVGVLAVAIVATTSQKRRSQSILTKRCGDAIRETLRMLEPLNLAEGGFRLSAFASARAANLRRVARPRHWLRRAVADRSPHCAQSAAVS